MFQSPRFALPDWFDQIHPAHQNAFNDQTVREILRKSRSRSSWGGLPTLTNDEDCNLHLRGVNVNHSGFRESASLPTPINWHSPAISRSHPHFTSNGFPFGTHRIIRTVSHICPAIPIIDSPGESLYRIYLFYPDVQGFSISPAFRIQYNLASGQPSLPVVCLQRRSPIPNHSR